MPPPSLSRLPPEPTASTFPFRRSQGRGCTVRKDQEEARNAAAAAAAGRPAPGGHCPRGCSQALRGALSRGRCRLSSPSPEPGLASQRLNSQTSIMAAASERRELSAAASQRPNAYPAAVHKESRHITVRRPARPLRRPPGARAPREPEGRGRRTRGSRGGAGAGGGSSSRGERGTPNLQALLSMPSVTAGGSLGLVPRRPLRTALATAVSAAARREGGKELNLHLCPET